MASGESDWRVPWIKENKGVGEIGEWGSENKEKHWLFG